MPMVVFTAAIERAFRNYFGFSGRSTRAEYWWWVLFVSVAPTILGVVGAIIGVGGILNGLFSLVTLVPGFALGARRLHDINKSGWWLLLMFAILIGWIILIVWAIKQGDRETNKYGPDPRTTPSS